MGTLEDQATAIDNAIDTDSLDVGTVDWLSGDLIVAIFSIDSPASDFNTPTDDSGDGVSWTQIGVVENIQSTPRGATAVWAKDANSNETGVTVNEAYSNSNAIRGDVLVFRGYTSTGATEADEDRGTAPYNTDPIALSASGLTAGSLNLIAIGNEASRTYSGWSGDFTEVYDSGSSNISQAVGYDLTGEAAPNESLSPSGNSHHQGVLVNFPEGGSNIAPTGHDASVTFGSPTMGGNFNINLTGLGHDASVTFGIAPVVLPGAVSRTMTGIDASVTIPTPTVTDAGTVIQGVGGEDFSVTFGPNGTVTLGAAKINTNSGLAGLDASPTFGAPTMGIAISVTGFNAGPTIGTSYAHPDINFAGPDFGPTFPVPALTNIVIVRPDGFVVPVTFGEDSLANPGTVTIAPTGLSTAVTFGTPQNVRITASGVLDVVWDTKLAVPRDLQALWGTTVTVTKDFSAYWNVEPSDGLAWKDLSIPWQVRNEAIDEPIVRDFPSPVIRQAALGSTTCIMRRVDIYQPDGVTPYFYDAPFAETSVTITGDSDARRTASMTLRAEDGRLDIAPDRFWYNKVIKIWRGIDAGTEIWWDSLGVFLPESIKRGHFPNTIELSLRDFSKKLTVTALAEAESYEKNQPIENIIAKLAVDGGISDMSLPLTGTSTDREFTFEAGTQRWQSMRDIAGAYAYDLYFDRNGKLVLQRTPDPQLDPIVYNFETGPRSNIATYTKTTNDSLLKNHIVVIGEAADQAPVSASAENTNLDSPTNVFPYPDGIGRRTRVIKSSFVGNEAQAQDLADQTIKRAALEQFDVPMGVIPFTWLDAHDVVTFQDPDPVEGDPNRYLITGMTISLSLDGPMQIQLSRVVDVS